MHSSLPISLGGSSLRRAVAAALWLIAGHAAQAANPVPPATIPPGNYVQRAALGDEFWVSWIQDTREPVSQFVVCDYLPMYEQCTFPSVRSTVPFAASPSMQITPYVNDPGAYNAQYAVTKNGQVWAINELPRDHDGLIDPKGLSFAALLQDGAYDTRTVETAEIDNIPVGLSTTVVELSRAAPQARPAAFVSVLWVNSARTGPSLWDYDTDNNTRAECQIVY